MPAPDIVFAYGPGPGMELIPYFLALLAWVGLAVLGILTSPFTAIARRLRGRRPAVEPTPSPAPETPGEGTANRA